MMTIQTLPLDRILTDAGTQMRIENDESTIAEYADALRQGCEFPPIIVFTDGISYWLADGFHRFEAHLRCCLETILCEIRQGTLNDAKKCACEANTKHGLQRTNEGKRKAIHEYLQLPGIAELSDLEIAKALRVSNHLVNKIRTKANVAPSPKAHVGNGAKKKIPSDKKPNVPSVKNSRFVNLYNVSATSTSQFVTILRAEFGKPYLHSLVNDLQRSLAEE